MTYPSFVVRVYGVYRHPEKGVLVSDEWIQGKRITKFPGGGLEFGEGTRECLIREMQEETGQLFSVLGHFYTTDFFVPSAFDDTRQVISIYYDMEPVEELGFDVVDELVHDSVLSEASQVFRWIPLSQIGGRHFSLIIDQHVGGLIKAESSH